MSGDGLGCGVDASGEGEGMAPLGGLGGGGAGSGGEGGGGDGGGGDGGGGEGGGGLGGGGSGGGGDGGGLGFGINASGEGEGMTPLWTSPQVVMAKFCYQHDSNVGRSVE